MATESPQALAQDQASVRRARDAFLSHDDPRADDEIRNPIKQSWQRSQASLVDADHPTPSFVDKVAADSVLTRAARPVFASLSSELTGEPACLILTDARGIVMERGGGDSTLLKGLDAVDLAPGFQYSETEVGTNGIGTALEVGGPILVNGDEHYTGGLRTFSCAGALVTHPVTGALLGVVDITTQAENSNSLLLSFAKLAARRIQERILEEANELDRALLGDYYAACRHTGGSVIAIGSDVFMMNALAQQNFDANDQAALIDQTRDAQGRTAPYTLLADLPSGISARLAYHPTFVGDALAGGIIQVKEQRAGARTSSSTQLPALPGLAGSSALWRHATQEVLDACGRSEWLVVEGEAGVGKISVLRAAHQHTSSSRSLTVLDATEPDVDLLERATSALESGADLIVCHAHLLHGEVLDGLAELLQDAHNKALARKQWVALTVQPSEIDDALGLSLLRLFPRTVALPPLRHHLEDVPALVRALLNRAGVPSLALSGSAINQLMRLPWAGNVTHLRDVVATVSRKRRSGIVEPQDLPAECHATTRRQLTKMESLERDAIVDALAANAGDKGAAATALGMSRATIYRKIRDYGIVQN